jgi:hypothetical protein
MKKHLLLISILCASFIGFSQDITSNLEAHFSFNDGTANVTSGIVNQAGFITGAITVDDRFGNPNAAMSFDGTDDYIDFGDLTNYQFGNDGFTVALWMKGNIAQVGQGIPIGKRGFNGGQDFAYMFGWKGNGELMLYYRDDNGTGGTFPTTFTDNSWTHIAMVFDRSVNVINFYVNGSLIIATDISNLGTFDATGPTQGGQLMAGRSSQGGQHFNGSVDDLYIYRRALTNADILALFNIANPLLNIEENNSAFNLSPNPVNSYINIQFKTPTICSIYNVDGRLITTLNESLFHAVDISSFESGIYFIKAGNQTQKFIKE